MLSKDLHALIARLEIIAKKQVSGPLLGDARTARIGSGFEFNQLRDYVQGDDIRFIDWKASARSNKMLVRQYLEDRNRTMYLVVDISASTLFGSSDKNGYAHKRDLMNQLGAILAFVSLHGKDSVGLILFTDTVEKVIPPRTSRSHALNLVHALFTHQPKSKKTHIEAPLDYIARLKGQRALICLISDFMESLEPYKRKLSAVARRHDITFFRCLDPRELTFPAVGTLIFDDSELGVQMAIAGQSSHAINQTLAEWHAAQKELLRVARIDCLDIELGSAFTGPLTTFLRYRAFMR